MFLKRYFIAPKVDMGIDVGDYHYIDLGSHGQAGKDMVVVVLAEGHRAPAHWEELPHLLDQSTTTEHPALADLGVKNMTGFQLAKHLAKIHPRFHP